MVFERFKRMIADASLHNTHVFRSPDTAVPVTLMDAVLNSNTAGQRLVPLAELRHDV